MPNQFLYTAENMFWTNSLVLNLFSEKFISVGI